MEPLKHLNLAMEYIESHLGEEINYNRVSQIALCSEYHFRRLFSFLSGMTLSEYIRMRRLTQAALELGKPGVRITDMALKYGYDSVDGFSRAFQNLHGVGPTEARKCGTPLLAVLPLTFRLTLQGGREMNYRIINKDAFLIAGVKKKITLIYNGTNPQMDSMWTDLAERGIDDLKRLSNEEPRGILCVSTNFAEGRPEGTELDQYIGVATSEEVPAGWDVLPVAASAWAVFSVQGPFPQTVQETWARIASEWLPTSGYELTGGPEILWNEGKDTSRKDYRSEIWIPVARPVTRS